VAIKYGSHWQEAFRHMRRPWWVVALLTLLALYFSTWVLWCMVSACTNQPMKYDPGGYRESSHPLPPWADTDTTTDAFSGEWWGLFLWSLAFCGIPAGLAALDYRNGWIIHQMDLERDAEKRRKELLEQANEP